jgi:HEAT repeat protein
MKRRLIWISFGVAAIAVVSIFVEPTQIVLGKLLGEAFFEGRPTRFWARSLRTGPAERAAAASQLEHGGADAVPVLAGIMTRSTAASEAELRWVAAELLGKLGPDAASAGPVLLIGLRDGDPYVQAVCATALAKVGVPAESAVPLLAELLKTQHAVVAARALSQYRGAAAASLPALVDLLQDKSQSAEARWNAARTIGKIGPAAVSAVPALIDTSNDKEWTIREHCAESIGEIGPSAAPLGIAALESMLMDPHHRVRRDAVRSLGHLGAAARDSLPEIGKLLDDPEEIVRQAAKTAMEAITPPQSIEPADSVTSPK